MILLQGRELADNKHTKNAPGTRRAGMDTPPRSGKTTD
jgi:hypothetical protein